MKKIQKYLKNINEQINEGNRRELKLKLMSLFKENPHLNDEAVDKIAEKLGIDDDELEDIIFSIVGSFLGFGKSVEMEGKFKVDPVQLEMGIKVEMEHTNCPLVAKKITMDHLAEFSDYYTRLAKMEKEAKEEE